jgi:hypothetical protein
LKNRLKICCEDIYKNMAALFPKIYDIIDKNPHKHATLLWRDLTPKEGSSEQWDIFQLQPLNPPGILSYFLMVTDPLYGLGSPSVRKQIQVEKLLELHERVDKELVGRRYPRKKIQDLLAGQIAVQTVKPTPLLEEVFCELFDAQKIQINRRTKEISFFPPDPRTWKSTRKIFVSDEENCWNYVPSQEIGLESWLLQKETDGWKISWPTADGKLDELKAGLLQRGFSLDGKQKKDDLAHRLGRLQAISLLSELALKLMPVKLETP